jgi:hypothetical protein
MVSDENPVPFGVVFATADRQAIEIQNLGKSNIILVNGLVVAPGETKSLTQKDIDDLYQAAEASQRKNETPSSSSISISPDIPINPVRVKRGLQQQINDLVRRVEELERDRERRESYEMEQSEHL